MAAFPGTLQSPFVVATDSPVQALGPGSLLAIDAAVERREARGRRPSKPKKPKPPKPAIPDAVDMWFACCEQARTRAELRCDGHLDYFDCRSDPATGGCTYESACVSNQAGETPFGGDRWPVS
jgi:hypothetical protein